MPPRPPPPLSHRCWWALHYTTGLGTILVRYSPENEHSRHSRYRPMPFVAVLRFYGSLRYGTMTKYYARNVITRGSDRHPRLSRSPAQWMDRERRDGRTPKIARPTSRAAATPLPFIVLPCIKLYIHIFRPSCDKQHTLSCANERCMSGRTII